jgi:Putative prokaryotic signal transducing protein
MSEKKWEVVESVGGDLNAELLRSYLEAQGIPVLLSQEGIGHSIYPVSIGRLGNVDILVPTEYRSQALELIKEFNARADQDIDDQPEEEASEDSSEP